MEFGPEARADEHPKLARTPVTKSGGLQYGLGAWVRVRVGRGARRAPPPVPEETQQFTRWKRGRAQSLSPCAFASTSSPDGKRNAFAPWRPPTCGLWSDGHAQGAGSEWRSGLVTRPWAEASPAPLSEGGRWVRTQDAGSQRKWVWWHSFQGEGTLADRRRARG